MLEKLYYDKYFSYHVDNVKATWRGIKQLITHKGGKLFFPSRLIVGDVTLTDVKSIAYAFQIPNSLIIVEVLLALKLVHRHSTLKQT